MNATMEYSARQQRPIYRRYLTIQSGVMKMLCVLFTACILALLFLVTIYLLVKGFKYLSWDVFTELPIPPGMEGAPGGLKNAVVGTGILVALASAVGIPLGVLAGIYLSEYSASSWLGAPDTLHRGRAHRRPLDRRRHPRLRIGGRSHGPFQRLRRRCALAFIMAPIVARTTEEMLRLVPHSYREASIALGATKARTIIHVILPAATGSIVTGIMLAIARIAGETAPLLFTALGCRLLTLDPAQPFPSLTVQVFVYATGPYRDEQNLAWAGMLILIGLVFVLNLALRLTVYRMQRKQLAAAG